MQQGAESVTIAPGVLAARQADVWANNTVASKSKFARNVGAVSVTDWREAFINKGLPRIASGAQSGQPKMEKFMAAFLPVVANAVKALPARGTYDQNKARANAMMDALHKFSYSGSNA